MKMKPIKMDLQQCGITPVIDAVQGESWSRDLEIELFSGKNAYHIPDNTAIIIRYKKADRTGGEYDTLPDGTPAWTVFRNRLTITLSDQAMTFPGKVLLTVSLVTAGTILSTFPIEVNVHASAQVSNAVSEDYFNLTGFLVAPKNADVGQILQVSSVDSQGKVTGLTTVNPETAGAGEADSEQIQRIVDAYLEENPPAQGEPGQDGISVTHSWSETVLTLNSASGTTSVDLQGKQGPQGEKGDTGATGPQGLKGDTGNDGVSPTVTVSKSGKVTTITITDTNGTKTATIHDGADGTDADAKNAVPNYWQTALEEGAEAINGAILNAGYNKSAFLFYSDAHWNNSAQISPALLKYLYEHTGMTRTFFGGDIVNNEADDYDTMKYLWDWRNQLKGLPNHHSVVGNHDDGNSVNNRFSEQYIYGYLLAAEETPDIVRGDAGLYYYVDSPAEKTRYLCLDTAYQGASSEQQAFVKNALMTTPEGWHIVAISHIWHDVDYNTTPPTVSGVNCDASTLLTMFDSYNSRNGDYADCGGWVEFCIGGHTHWDYDSTSNLGIPIILVETDSQHIRSGLDFTAGTTSEASINGIIADYGAHKIHIIRIGRGESRDITVTNYAVSYTNVLSLSLAADGVSTYNADGTPGYKANTRWSQSGQSDQDSDGNYITGWIPVSQYDIIYLKDMTVTSSNCTFLYSDAPGSTVGSAGYDTLISWNGVTDDSGNIVQFEYMNTHPYIRIQCGGISETSIITINEPIA